MMDDSNTRSDQQRRDYLLGYLDDSAMARLEDSYVGNKEVFERLEAVLDNLDDAYVHGRLSDADRRRYEERYRSGAEGISRMAFATALREDLQSERRSFIREIGSLLRAQRPTLQFALAAVLLLLVAGPPMAAIRISHLNREIGGLRSELETAMIEAEQERALQVITERRLEAFTTTSFDLFPRSPEGRRTAGSWPGRRCGPVPIGPGTAVAIRQGSQRAPYREGSCSVESGTRLFGGIRTD
jgi:hypothetical protein